MKYSLEEHLQTGETVVLGEPFLDLLVAKVIASQRAFRTGRVVVVRDDEKSDEVARYEPSGEPLSGSVQRLRAAGVFGAPSEPTGREKTSA